MANRYDNARCITAAQRTVCDKLVGQTAKLVNVIGQAVAAGVPQEDCDAMFQHLASHCQQPLPPEIHPAMTAAVECVRATMATFARRWA